MWRNQRKWWQGLSLTRQFAAVAIAILLPAMLAVGWWISGSIRQAVVHNTAAAIALYMDGLVAPFIEELQATGTLSQQSRQQLDTLLLKSRIDSRIISMKIWKKDGVIIYSTFPDMIGQKFPPSENFAKALSGKFGADFNNGPHVEDEMERASGKMLLEVYAPVRDQQSRAIVAVSEFYANGNDLAADIWRATITSWAIVFGATSLVVFLLSGIVGRGSRTILQQQELLANQVNELTVLLQQNETLRASLKKSSADVASINERVLQQVGSDLHDGPAQMLAYVKMRLSKLRRLFSNRAAGEKELGDVARILDDALHEVRRTSQGLILPELRQASLSEAIELAITTHEDHTGTRVARDLAEGCENVPPALKICAYRVVQEALNNAFKHAAGLGLRVELRCVDGIDISIHDAGEGFKVQERSGAGLGLSGMRARVQALGGRLSISTSNTDGTVVRAVFAQRGE